MNWVRVAYSVSGALAGASLRSACDGSFTGQLLFALGLATWVVMMDYEGYEHITRLSARLTELERKQEGK